MSKEDVAYLYKGMLLSHEKKKSEIKSKIKEKKEKRSEIMPFGAI